MKSKGFLPFLLFSLVLSSCQFVTSSSTSGTNPITSTSDSEEQKYTITWKNYDGTILEVDYEVLKDTIPVYDGNTPTKPSTNEFYYSFKGWTPEIVPVTSDATYTATFRESINAFTIRWENEDGSLLREDQLKYGELPQYKGALPTKEGDAQYSYTFGGWSPNIVPVVKNTTYTATFTASINSYTVWWVNYEGTELEVDYNVEYGTIPQYDGETPIKEEDAGHEYSFLGWSPSVGPVKGDVTYVAIYYDTTKSYNVTWLNYDGTLLKEDVVQYGLLPSYDLKEPVRDGDAQYTYTFLSWSPEISVVLGDITYTATYIETINSYTITWLNDDGTLLKEDIFQYGVMPHYTGQTPIKTATNEFSFIFNGWSPTVTVVTDDITYVAKFIEETNTYTITWKNYDGVLLNEEKLKYGETPIYEGKTPTKDGDVVSSFVFTGWSPTITAVREDATYIAQFMEVVNTYQVSWKDHEGNVLEIATDIQYADISSFYTLTPTRESDHQFSFTWINWKEIVDVNNKTIILTPLYKATMLESKTSLNEATQFKDSIAEVILNGSMTRIDSYSLQNFTALTKIVIPSNVVTVSGFSFANCSSLTTVTFPNGLKTISPYAFTGCSSLVDVYIPASVTSIQMAAFKDCVSLTSIVIPSGITTIASALFSGCINLTEVILPATLTVIGNSAFRECSALKNITIPANVRTIENGAFSDCSSLNNVLLPSKVNYIEGSAFENCTALTSLAIPYGVTEIAMRTFKGCTAITSIIIPISVTSIRMEAFIGCSALESINLPNSISTIEMGAFRDCSSLISITVPSSVTSIAEGTFHGCTSLTSITLPYIGQPGESNAFGYIFGTDYYVGGVSTNPNGPGYFIPNSLKTVIITGGTHVGHEAFKGCKTLTTVVLPTSVVEIGIDVFSGCVALESITLPYIGSSEHQPFYQTLGFSFGRTPYEGGVATNQDGTVYYFPPNLREVIITNQERIPGSAFQNCTTLTNIILPDFVTYIGNHAFQNCTSLTSITIPSGVTEINYGLFRGCTGLVELNLPDGIILIDNYAFYGCASLTEFAIPEGQNKIGEFTFYGCLSLKSITIPNSVLTIQDGAFKGCSSLTAITIPNTVFLIGSYAFQNCSSLISIIVPTSVEEIGAYAFSGCSALKSIELLGNIYIISAYMFSDCISLTTIILPKNIVFIDSFAFSGCTSLTAIVIPRMLIYVDETSFSGAKNVVLYLDEGASTESWQLNWNENDIIVYNHNEWHYVDGVPTPY